MSDINEFNNLTYSVFMLIILVAKSENLSTHLSGIWSLRNVFFWLYIVWINEFSIYAFS